MTSFGARCVCAAVALCLAGPAIATEDLHLDSSNRILTDDVEARRAELNRIHRACNSGAQHGSMPFQTIYYCADVYLALKLSFMPGASLERFKTLSPATRAMANRKGYDAYRAWLHRQIVSFEPGRSRSGH